MKVGEYAGEGLDWGGALGEVTRSMAWWLVVRRTSDSDLMNSDLIFWISYEFLLMWYVEFSGGTSTPELRFDFSSLWRKHLPSPATYPSISIYIHFVARPGPPRSYSYYVYYYLLLLLPDNTTSLVHLTWYIFHRPLSLFSKGRSECQWH